MDRQIRPGELFSSVIKKRSEQLNHQNASKQKEENKTNPPQHEVTETFNEKQDDLTKKDQQNPQSKPDENKVAAITPESKDTNEASSIFAPTAKSQLNKKRVRPPDEKSNENGSIKDNPSSKNPVAVPKSAVKAIRLERKQ